MMDQNLDELPHIIIERGSYFTHCGYSGRDEPEFSLRTPLISVEAQFTNIFEEVLKVDPAQHKVIIVKDAGTPQQVLRDEAHLLFTKFHVKACAFINAQLGTLFSWVFGPNALIIDIGYKSTLVVPIIDLMTQMDLLTEIPIAGESMERYIISHLIKNGIPEEIIKNHKDQLFPYLMKEYYYFDSESEDDFERAAIDQRKLTIPKYLKLSDHEGKVTEVSLPDPILPPNLIIETCNSHNLSFSKEINNQIIKILESIGVYHLESLYEHNFTTKWVERIIITGGASNILGLRSVIIRELLKKTEIKRYMACNRSVSSPLVDVEFKGVAFTIRNIPSENAPSTWVGASIETSLKSFQKCFVSKETYYTNPDLFFQLEHEGII